MRYVFVSYNYSPDFTTPESWFTRTAGYSGIMECLSRSDEVINVKQINYTGNTVYNGVDYRFVAFDKKKTYFPLKLNQYVKSLDPDVIVIQGLHHPLQVIQLHFILESKTRIIAHHHAEKPFPWIKKYAQRLADNFIDAYLFASFDLGLDWVTKGNIASAKKIHEVMEVSSNFQPVNRAASKSKTGVSGAPAFLWVGRLNANKDPLNVVTAFLKYVKENPAACLYMIYHTDDLIVEIKDLISNDVNGKAIKLIGKVPHGDLLYWYNSADFFISGSHYEGAGTAVCEAMSCGCVPVVTNIFSFRMMTDNGNCGLLYEPGNADALLTALRQVKNMDQAAKSELSLTWFREKLSFSAIAKRIAEIAASL
jgi:glycosyltransferase involved in cell wall biosynthesis